VVQTRNVAARGSLLVQLDAVVVEFHLMDPDRALGGRSRRLPARQIAQGSDGATPGKCYRPQISLRQSTAFDLLASILVARMRGFAVSNTRSPRWE
jgi:hypothetical protein